MRNTLWFNKHRYAQADDGDFEKRMRDLLVGRKIIKATKKDEQEAELLLDDGTILIAIGNEGCGGCGNGWYYLDELNGCDNAITKVECCVGVAQNGYDDVYHLFVFADNKKINCLQYHGSDNGYYGTGYDLYILKPEEE